ncbi:zinc-dependent peptidase [Pusillimonas sp. ANT_WB101]|uniref:M90 family metallopeptidase n=1 Tax=Pusillimonas sp. ANT_WB101 TaxID=2597356 RepID=UPI0011EE8B93|nr:M90 family metallopeptidase [Pusillimonas sp. ANT_WB101]KAA0892997.1 zinc-dependent peptidase [Pusillimonas sp. ANT_WB101]
MLRWLSGLGAPQRKVEQELALITDEVWHRAIMGHFFLAGLKPDEDLALKQRTAWLLASKQFSGVQGLELTRDIMLSVAIQAALPIMQLSPRLYEGWTEIILYPSGFLIPRAEVDESGVVHEYMMEASGEAWDGGPLILSWEDAEPGLVSRANVVIHEFAHKLDLYGSDADGMPSLGAHPDISVREWQHVLQASFDEFSASLVAAEDAIPSYVDPESAEAEPWLASLPLDPYAATDHAEFFAVSTEAFFVDPARLAQGLPQWYALLARYYRQDPYRRMTVSSV